MKTNKLLKNIINLKKLKIVMAARYYKATFKCQYRGQFLGISKYNIVLNVTRF